MTGMCKDLIKMKKETFDFPNTVPFTWKDLAKTQAESGGLLRTAQRTENVRLKLL